MSRQKEKTQIVPEENHTKPGYQTEHLDTATPTPIDGRPLLEPSSSANNTENRVHHIDAKCKPRGDEKLEIGKAKRKYKSFSERIEELKLFYNEHGHVNISEKENKAPHIFCVCMRCARNNPEKSKTALNPRVY